MPVHDWTKVDSGIFHAFHHSWIEELSRQLNGGILPEGFYALPEQHAAGFGPDVLALQDTTETDSETDGSKLNLQHNSPGLRPTIGNTSTLTLSKPTLLPTCESDLEFYRRKQSNVVIRHVSGDRVVAMIEIVSPGNRATQRALAAFINKAADLLEKGIHLLVIDLFPAGPRDPNGLHAAIWEQVSGVMTTPADKPVNIASYESATTIRAYVKGILRSDDLPEMPLFLLPDACINLPLEQNYQAAFLAQPRRWREVLDTKSLQ